MDEIILIARKLRELECCGELRIIYMTGIGSKALVMANTDKFCIAINPCLSYEQQIKELWHEAKHIYSHLNTNCSVSVAESEAEEFSVKALRYSDVLINLQAVDNL